MVDLRFRAVLFDLFDTLLLLDDAEVFYPVCLERTFEFLLNRAINVSYEAFKKTYSTVRMRWLKRLGRLLRNLTLTFEFLGRCKDWVST